jgi:hypothetical protein
VVGPGTFVLRKVSSSLMMSGSHVKTDLRGANEERIAWEIARIGQVLRVHSVILQAAGCFSFDNFLAPYRIEPNARAENG